jgi:hypothetical protein
MKRIHSPASLVYWMETKAHLTTRVSVGDLRIMPSGWPLAVSLARAHTAAGSDYDRRSRDARHPHMAVSWGHAHLKEDPMFIHVSIHHPKPGKAARPAMSEAVKDDPFDEWEEKDTEVFHLEDA